MRYFSLCFRTPPEEVTISSEDESDIEELTGTVGTGTYDLENNVSWDIS